MRDNVGAALINSGRIRRPIAYAQREIATVTRFLLPARRICNARPLMILELSAREACDY